MIKPSQDQSLFTVLRVFKVYHDTDRYREELRLVSYKGEPPVFERKKIFRDQDGNWTQGGQRPIPVTPETLTYFQEALDVAKRFEETSQAVEEKEVE